MKLIIGLGNPGDKYKNTRHNLGFMVAEELVEKMEDGKWKMDQKFDSEILKNKDVLLVKPQTFMNNSGEAVKLMVGYYKIEIENIVVIHDDLDLPLGKIKIQAGGSAAGHHGVESIINSLGSDKFIRVRLGIGPSSVAAEEFVLEEFTEDENNEVAQMVRQAVESVQMLLDEGIKVAQNQYN